MEGRRACWESWGWRRSWRASRGVRERSEASGRRSDVGLGVLEEEDEEGGRDVDGCGAGVGARGGGDDEVKTAVVVLEDGIDEGGPAPIRTTPLGAILGAT